MRKIFTQITRVRSKLTKHKQQRKEQRTNKLLEIKLKEMINGN